MNDTSVIQTALNAGGSLILMPGNYSFGLTNYLTISKGSTMFQGLPGSVISLAAGYLGTFLFVSASNVSVSGISFQGHKWTSYGVEGWTTNDGGGTNKHGGIFIQVEPGANNSAITNNQFSDFGVGVNVGTLGSKTPTTDAQVIDNYFFAVSQGAIAFGNFNDAQFTGNTVINSYDDALSLNAGSDAGNSGEFIAGSIISDNYVDGNQGTGQCIDIANEGGINTAVTINGNTLRDCLTGIYVDDQSSEPDSYYNNGIVISGNSIGENDTLGLPGSYSAVRFSAYQLQKVNATVSSNVIESLQDGITFDNVSNAVISNNEFTRPITGTGASASRTMVSINNSQYLSFEINDIQQNNGCGTLCNYFVQESAYHGGTVKAIVFEGNNFQPISGDTILYALISGANTFAGNQGYNPQGFSATTPPVVASGTSVINDDGYAVGVYFTSGTLTQIQVNGTTVWSSTNPVSAQGEFYVPPGSTIAYTNSTDVVWAWYGM